jgi:hypothetical protein
MKRVLSCFLLLLVSCSHDSLLEPAETEIAKGDIDFRIATLRTKALEITDANIPDFSVSAIWKRQVNDHVTNFMSETEVSKNGNKWEYSPLRYWPGVGSIDFYAYSPAKAIGIDSWQVISDAANDTTAARLIYSVSTDQKKQEDFLVASAFDKTANPVEIVFEHALAQVEFKARSGAPGVIFRVRRIEMINLDRKGTLSLKTSSTSACWSDNTELSEKDETYAVYLPRPIDFIYEQGSTAEDYAPVVQDDLIGNLMILPQKVTIGSEIPFRLPDVGTFYNGIKVSPGMVGQPKDLTARFYIAVTFDAVANYGLGDITLHANSTVYFPLFVIGDAADPIAAVNAGPFEFVMGKKYTFLLELGKDLDVINITIAETGWNRNATIN